MRRAFRLGIAAIGATVVSAGCGDDPVAPAVPPVGSRTLDGIAFHAAPASLEPSASGGAAQIRIAVTITNTTAELRLVGAAGCGGVRIFRSVARTGVPAWNQDAWLLQSNARCGASLPTFDIAPGASIEQSFFVNPAAVVGDSLPPGRYYFAIRLDVEPKLGARGAGLELAAGDLQLQR